MAFGRRGGVGVGQGSSGRGGGGGDGAWDAEAAAIHGSGDNATEVRSGDTIVNDGADGSKHGTYSW